MGVVVGWVVVVGGVVVVEATLNVLTLDYGASVLEVT